MDDPASPSISNAQRARRKPSWLNDAVTEFENLRDRCPFCDKRFLNEMRVAKHVRNVHRKPFKCDLCRRQYYSEAVLQEHRKTHNTDSHFECKVCHLKYKREETLNSHFVRVHSDVDPKFTCDHCNKKYKLKQDLLLHINQVHVCNYQICRFCGKAVKNVKAHEWHHQQKMKPVSDDKIYRCSLCFKKFLSESKLENHLMRHVQRYECQECNETFPGPAQLMNHKSKHRPGVTCDICQKYFASRSNYYQHVLMHAKVRPYKCDVCKETFTQRSTLVRHRKSHPQPLNGPIAQVPIAELARKVLKSYKNYAGDNADGMQITSTTDCFNLTAKKEEVEEQVSFELQEPIDNKVEAEIQDDVFNIVLLNAGLLQEGELIDNDNTVGVDIVNGLGVIEKTEDFDAMYNQDDFREITFIYPT